MEGRIPIKYGAFYDVPRQIGVRFNDEWFFLHSEFDEEQDEYPDSYEVYLLRPRTEQEAEADPQHWLDVRDAVHLGRVSVSEVGLDPTRRKSIDADAFTRWLAAHRRQ